MRRKPEPATDPAGFAIFRGHGFKPIEFPALPGVKFPPGVPVAVTGEQSDIIRRRNLQALAFCDAEGNPVLEPVPEPAAASDVPAVQDDTDSPATGPANEESE